MNRTALALATVALTVSTPALADPLPPAPQPNYFQWFQASNVSQLISQFGTPVEVWTPPGGNTHRRWKVERFVQVDCESRLQIDEMIVVSANNGAILDRDHFTNVTLIPPEYGIIDAGCDK